MNVDFCVYLSSYWIGFLIEANGEILGFFSLIWENSVKVQMTEDWALV